MSQMMSNKDGRQVNVTVNHYHNTVQKGSGFDPIGTMMQMQIMASLARQPTPAIAQPEVLQIESDSDKIIIEEADYEVVDDDSTKQEQPTSRFDFWEPDYTAHEALVEFLERPEIPHQIEQMKVCCGMSGTWSNVIIQDPPPDISFIVKYAGEHFVESIDEFVKILDDEHIKMLASDLEKVIERGKVFVTNKDLIDHGIVIADRETFLKAIDPEIVSEDKLLDVYTDDLIRLMRMCGRTSTNKVYVMVFLVNDKTPGCTDGSDRAASLLDNRFAIISLGGMMTKKPINQGRVLWPNLRMKLRDDRKNNVVTIDTEPVVGEDDIEEQEYPKRKPVIGIVRRAHKSPPVTAMKIDEFIE